MSNGDHHATLGSPQLLNDRSHARSQCRLVRPLKPLRVAKVSLKHRGSWIHTEEVLRNGPPDVGQPIQLPFAAGLKEKMAPDTAVQIALISEGSFSAGIEADFCK